nr:PREDICTED: uncharacterized protein LOC109041207 [Bemisia tabaci]
MDRKNFQLNKFLKKPDNNNFSDDKIQEKLYAWFEDQGLLSEFKAHIRQKMISALKGTSLGVESLNRNGAKSVSPKLQAVNLLISDYLLRLQHHYTLSVFFTEVPSLTSLSEFSTYITRLADKNYAESSGSEPLPRIDTADVKDILQALGFSPDQGVSIKTRRLYQFNRENKALLMCLLDSLQDYLNQNCNYRDPQKTSDSEENELWPREIRDVFINSDFSFEQLEILQDHITRYYKNAVKKLKAEEEAKYRLKVSEVLQKERETYGKLAETEKRLIEQQEIIEKEIASREDQLKTLSSALRKQHEAISERLSQLQEESLKLEEKEKQLKLERGKEAEKLEAKKSELDLKEKELDAAYAQLAEDQKKIADEKKTLELTQKLITGSNNLNSNEPHDNVKFLQQLAQQCSALTKKLAVIRDKREKAPIENPSTSPSFKAVDSFIFDQHKDLIQETKLNLEQKMNELMLKLEEIKEAYSVKTPAKHSYVDDAGTRSKVIDVGNEKKPVGDLDLNIKNDSNENATPSATSTTETCQKYDILVPDDLSQNCCDSGRQSPLQALKDENDNKIDVNSSRTTLFHRLNVERHMVKKLQEENTELKAQALLQNQKIIDLTLQTRELESRLSMANTVRVVTVSSDPTPHVPVQTSAVSPYSPVVATAAPFALTRPRRQWFNRHVGSGEESMFSSTAATANSARSRLRELRRKLPRRIVAPIVVSQSSSTETSSGQDTIEETRKRLKRLEKENSAVNRLYQDYQSKKEQHLHSVYQPAETVLTSSQPVYCSESQRNCSTLMTSTFSPYTSFRPICSTLRPMITSVTPQASFCNQNTTVINTQKSACSDFLNEPSQKCAILDKITKHERSDVCNYLEGPQQCSNRKFRHYYRDWLECHFRKSCPSPSETETSHSRVSPLKQIFHLKQYKYKKSTKNRADHETEKVDEHNPNSLEVLHLAGANDKTPQVIIIENKDDSNHVPLPNLNKNDSLMSSSDLDDSLNFEKLILQNQQNVAALRQKFEQLCNFNSSTNSSDGVADCNKQKKVKNIRRPPANKNAHSVNVKVNVNTAESNETTGSPDEPAPKSQEVSKSLDVNTSAVPAKPSTPPPVEITCSDGKKLVSSSELEALPKKVEEINVIPETFNSKLCLRSPESLADKKIKDNYKRLSLYHRLNDYYEEIINEMNVSEEEKQNLSDIDHLLQPVEADPETFLVNDEDAKLSEHLVRAEPVICVTQVESSHRSPSGHSI